MKRIRIVMLSVVIVAVVFVSARYGFTVVTVEQLEAVRLAGVYDADEYVDEIWDATLIPTVDENAANLSAILTEFEVAEEGVASKERLSDVAEEYGRITDGEAHVYMVAGQGEVIEVDTESRVGTLALSLDGYDGPTEVRLFVGPRIPSDESSVRDAVGFISFGDFRDQTEYGRVAAAINSKINEEILEPLDKEGLVGERVSFRGAFSIRTFNRVDIDLSTIYVTPTYLALE
jgi:predicted lipoprotein